MTPDTLNIDISRNVFVKQFQRNADLRANVKALSKDYFSGKLSKHHLERKGKEAFWNSLQETERLFFVHFFSDKVFRMQVLAKKRMQESGKINMRELRKEIRFILEQKAATVPETTTGLKLASDLISVVM